MERRRRSADLTPALLMIIFLLLIVIILGVIYIMKTPKSASDNVSVSDISSREEIILNTSIPSTDLETPDEVQGKSDVVVIATGGTIAGIAADEDDFTLYSPGVLSIADMVNEISSVKSFANVTTKQFANQSSGSTSTQNLYDLSLAVENALKTADSVVVTCGTDIMEEIAYFLDLTVQSPKPVVVTGSMKPWNVIGTDAKINLYNAIKVAASNKTYKFGTVVVLNEEIHSAREVSKTNSHRTDAFSTPLLGMLGYVDENDVSIYRIPTRAAKSNDEWATPFDLTKISASDIPYVGIVVSHQGATGDAIKALVEAGAKGIVTMGTGNGGISQSLLNARNEALNQGIIVVATTRTGSGTMYSEDRDGSGLISADNLNAYHARIALELSLAYSSNYHTIQSWFEDYIRVGF